MSKKQEYWVAVLHWKVGMPKAVVYRKKVSGYRVKSIYPEIKLRINRGTRDCLTGNWVVTELTSGYGFGYGNTKQDAINDAHNNIVSYSLTELRKLIDGKQNVMSYPRLRRRERT